MTDHTLHSLVAELRASVGGAAADTVRLDLTPHVFPDGDSPLRSCTECDGQWFHTHMEPCVVRIVADIVNTRAHDQYVLGSLAITRAHDPSPEPRVTLRFTAEDGSYEREAVAEATAASVLDAAALHGWAFAGSPQRATDTLAPLRALACLQGIDERERMSLGADAWATTPQGASQLLYLLVDLVEGAIALDTHDPRVILASRLLQDAAQLHGTQPIGTERTIPISDVDATSLLNGYLNSVRRPPTA